MDTMGSTQSLKTYKIQGLEIMSLDQKNSIQLLAIYSKDKIPVSKLHIPTMEDLQKWPHLHDIDLPQIDSDIGLLIGNNITDVCSPLEVRVGPAGTPYATRSALGWIPWNVHRQGIGQSVNVNIINHADGTIIEEIQELKDMYVKLVNSDFPEKIADDQKEYSVEDRQFIKKVK
jgi:hypothetical protein